MIEELKGRDMVNTHAVAKKVNQFIEVLNKVGGFGDNKESKEGEKDGK